MKEKHADVRRQEDINLSVERRLTRLEYFAYVLMTLSGLTVLGVRVFDPIALWHP